MVFTTSTCFYVIWKLELQCGDDSIHRHAKSAGQPIFFQTLSEKNTVNMNGKVKNSKENLPTVFQNSICINQSQGTYSKKNKLTYI